MKDELTADEVRCYYGEKVMTPEIFAELERMGFFQQCSPGLYSRSRLVRPDNLTFRVSFSNAKLAAAAAATKKVQSEKEKFQNAVAEEVIRQRERDARLLKKNVLTELSKALSDDDTL